MKNHNLRGAGTVFRYTMQQHYKTKSVQIFLIILFCLAVASLPLISMTSGSKIEVSETKITKLYVRNEIGFPLDIEDIHKDARYAGITMEETTLDKDALSEMLNKESEYTAAAAVLEVNTTTGGFKITGYYGADGQITSDDMGSLNGVLRDALHESLLRSLDITKEQEATVNSTAVSEVKLVSEFRNNAEIASTDTHVMVNIFYSYAVMVLGTLAMSYIFQLCMEEKTSKLVESLLVSVKPMALLVGKILAVTCFVFFGIGLIAAGLFISYQIVGKSGDDRALEAVRGLGRLFGVDFSAFNMSLVNVLLLIVCVLIAYSIIASFSGIVGSCCSKTEDIQHASLAVVLFLMVGYMTASFAPMFESDTANIVLSVFPLTSMYMALPNYICGKIGLPVLLIGTALQLVTAYFLAKLAGAVYSMMLLYRGEFPKPKQLFAMLRETRASEKAAAGREANHEH